MVFVMPRTVMSAEPSRSRKPCPATCSAAAACPGVQLSQSIEVLVNVSLERVDLLLALERAGIDHRHRDKYDLMEVTGELTDDV